MVSSKQHPSINSENGASLIVLVLILGIFALIGLQTLGRRLATESRALAIEELQVDELRVLWTIKHNGQCDKSNIYLDPPCPADGPGSIKFLRAEDGSTLIKSDGSTKIGKWNVRIRCSNVTSPASFGIEVGLFSSQPDQLPTGPLKHPLSDSYIPGDWKRILDWEEMCGKFGTGADFINVPSEYCFGTPSGAAPLPSDVTKQKVFPYARFKWDFLYGNDVYCTTSQRSFPSCPTGYRKTFVYIDRYGWAGRDLTAYTQCERILWGQ